MINNKNSGVDDLATQSTDNESEEYIDNLVNESYKLFGDNESVESTIQSSKLSKIIHSESSDIDLNEFMYEDNDTHFDESEDINNSSTDIIKKKTPHKIRLNKGLLALGCCMIVCTMIIHNSMSKKNYANLPDADVYSDVEAINNGVSEINSTAVESINDDKSVGENILIEEDIDNGEEKPMEGEHLTGIPVVVTEEVDAYFKDCISYLKSALSIDDFIANNTIFQNQDMINSLQLMVTDYENNVGNWEEHNIPKGCERFDELITKSLSVYQYYFKEVIDASNLETKEEYRNKLDAAIAYVQTMVGRNYDDVSQEFGSVFYYYGLYT